MKGTGDSGTKNTTLFIDFLSHSILRSLFVTRYLVIVNQSAGENSASRRAAPAVDRNSHRKNNSNSNNSRRVGGGGSGIESSQKDLSEQQSDVEGGSSRMSRALAKEQPSGSLLGGGHESNVER